MVKTRTVSDRLRTLANEVILGKCCRNSPSFKKNQRISPLTVEYKCPQLSLSIINSALETDKRELRSNLIIPFPCPHSSFFTALACLKHFSLRKLNVPNMSLHTQSSADTFFRNMPKLNQIHTHRANLQLDLENLRDARSSLFTYIIWAGGPSSIVKLRTGC